MKYLFLILIWVGVLGNIVAQCSCDDCPDPFVIEFKLGLCNEQLESYFVNVRLTGGVPPYYFDGEEVSTNFNTPTIASGTGYSHILTDSMGCELVLEGLITCGCINYPGTMSLDTLYGCIDDSLVGQYNEDAFLNNGDTSLFILHTSQDTEHGNIILFLEDPIMNYSANLQLDQVYYLSHAIGRIGDNGGIDTSDVCFRITAGQPIVFSVESQACACPVPEFVITHNDCYGDELGSIEIVFPEDITDQDLYQVVVNQSDVTNIMVFENLKAGIYSISISGPNDCITIESIELTEPQPISVTLGDDFTVLINDSFQVQAIVNVLEEKIENVSWSSLQGMFNDTDLLLNTSLISGDKITISIEDENGCTANDDINIRVDRKDPILPNIFNPKSNSANGKFELNNIEGSVHVSLSVYDRWGSLVYLKDEASPLTNKVSWNGISNNSIVPVGVYVYKIIITYDGNEEVFLGDIMVVY